MLFFYTYPLNLKRKEKKMMWLKISKNENYVVIIINEQIADGKIDSSLRSNKVISGKHIWNSKDLSFFFPPKDLFLAKKRVNRWNLTFCWNFTMSQSSLFCRYIISSSEMAEVFIKQQKDSFCVRLASSSLTKDWSVSPRGQWGSS